MLLRPFVDNRADRTGLMMRPIDELLERKQLLSPVPVQVPSAVRLSVYPFSIWAFVIVVVSFVSVGVIRSPSGVMYAFEGSEVVQSKVLVL